MHRILCDDMKVRLKRFRGRQKAHKSIGLINDRFVKKNSLVYGWLFTAQNWEIADWNVVISPPALPPWGQSRSGPKNPKETPADDEPWLAAAGS